MHIFIQNYTEIFLLRIQSNTIFKSMVPSPSPKKINKNPLDFPVIVSFKRHMIDFTYAENGTLILNCPATIICSL